MNKLIVTGGSGLLGSNIQSVADKHFEVFCPTKTQFDLRFGLQEITQYLYDHKSKAGRTIVLNCAAITQTKMNNVSRNDLYDINVLGPRLLCQVANNLNYIHDFKVVQISTDYVFDGEIRSGGYYEGSFARPLNDYSLTKLLGDENVLALGHRVIRTSFCGLIWPYQFAFEDKYSSFDTVDIIADLIVKVLLKIDDWDGIINVGTERKTFYELAKRYNPRVKPNSIKDVSLKIPRDTTLDLSKMNIVLGEKDARI